MKSLLSRVAHVVVAVTLIAGIAGCSRKPKSLTPLPAGQSKSSAPTGDVPVGIGGGVTPGVRLPGGLDPSGGSKDLPITDPSLPSDLDPSKMKQDRDTLATETIYFDFDKSNVKPQYAANINKVAEHLKAHGDTKLLVEGHCDDRGTEEYNLALGERRALAIREKLLAAGVSGDRMTTISFGKEKPAMVGATEEAYSKNRRGVFVLLLPRTDIR